MQTVSNNWKNEHKKSILNESFVEVSLDIADPDALNDASSEDNGAIYISDSSKLAKQLNKTNHQYCTLEQNLWCLDGNRKAIPEDNYKNDTYVSDVLSDDTCVFSTKYPIITINFSKVFEKLIPGITITWSEAYGEFAETFEVIAYKGDVITASKEMTGNRSVKTLILLDINEYDRIVIIIKKWCLPNHRARVEEILAGLSKIYGRGQLFDYSHSQSVDTVSTTLPKFEIKFSIDNVDGEYNPHNPEGMAKYLMERQEVKARYGLKLDDGSIEWIPGGTFYLSEWYAKQNGITADFTARDLLEFMSDVYTETHDLSERTLYSLAEMVLTKANLPLINNSAHRWIIDESLQNIKTSAPLPIDTLASCLQLIANAGRCVLYQDRNGILHLEPVKGSDTDTSTDTDYRITSFNSYSKPEITLSKPLKQVKVKVYTYTSDGESTSDAVAYPTDLNAADKGETIIIDNPLITRSEDAYAVGEWLYNNLRHRMTLDFSWRVDVGLDALDIIKNENDYSTNRVRMTEIEFKYNGAFRGTGKGKVIGNG